MFDTAARLVLSPLLIAQALRVRRQAQSLPEAVGPRAGVTGNGPSLVLRIIGDSSGAGVGATVQAEALSGQTVAPLTQSFTVHWALDATTGATTRSTLARLEQSNPQKTDIIVTALGVNDITRLIPTKVWLRQQRRLHDRIRALYQPRHIYLSGVPPLQHFPLLPNPLRWTLARHGARFEQALKAYAAQTSDLSYVPFQITPRPDLMASDGFHPSPELYTLWGQEMASRIISDWPDLGSD